MTSKQKAILDIYDSELAATGKKPTSATILQKLDLPESSGSYVRQVIRQYRKNGTPSKHSTPKRNPPLRTVKIDELIDKERLDVKRIILEGLEKIPEGQLAYDEDFRRDMGVAVERWRRYSTDDDFDTFKALLPSRKYVWGQADTIAELKQQDGVR